MGHFNLRTFCCWDFWQRLCLPRGGFPLVFDLSISSDPGKVKMPCVWTVSQSFTIMCRTWRLNEIENNVWWQAGGRQRGKAFWFKTNRGIFGYVCFHFLQHLWKYEVLLQLWDCDHNGFNYEKLVGVSWWSTRLVMVWWLWQVCRWLEPLSLPPPCSAHPPGKWLWSGGCWLGGGQEEEIKKTPFGVRDLMAGSS